jgi:hypothetical protein
VDSRLQGELGYAGMPNRAVMKSFDQAHRLWPAISLFLFESYGLFRCLATCATHSETSHTFGEPHPFLHDSVILLDHIIQVLALAQSNATRQRTMVGPKCVVILSDSSRRWVSLRKFVERAERR